MATSRHSLQSKATELLMTSSDEDRINQPRVSGDEVALKCSSDIERFNCNPVDDSKLGGAFLTVRCLGRHDVSSGCKMATRRW